MSKTWLTADWHIGETRFEIMNRPFTDPQEHVDVLVVNHNKLVAPDDQVYVIGDVLNKDADPLIFLPQIDRFNGRKILLRGNHDRLFSDADFSPYFETIYAEGEGLDVEFEGIPCHLVHYPSLGVKNLWNFVGHIHSAWKFQLNMINVGVDANHFYPTSSTKIPSYINAICNFYDNDVWVAYNEVNLSHLAERGKKSNYFTK